MVIKLTPEEAKSFQDNGFTQEEFNKNIDNFRSQGLSDDEIMQKVKIKLKSFSQPKQEVVQDIPLNAKNITPEQIKYPVKNPTPEFKAQIDKIEQDKNNQINKMRLGTGMMIASPLITLGTGGLSIPAQLGLLGAEGATYGIGEGLQKNNLNPFDVAKNSALGAGIGGATLGLQKAVGKIAPKLFPKAKPISLNKTIEEPIQQIDNTIPKVTNEIVQATDNIDSMPTIGELPIQEIAPIEDGTKAFKIEADYNQPPNIPPNNNNTALASMGDELPQGQSTELSLTPQALPDSGGGMLPPAKPPSSLEQASNMPMEEYIYDGERVGQKVRKTYESLDASKFGDNAEFMQDIEPNKMYDTVNNVDTLKQAMALSDQEADAIIKSQEPSALRTMTNIKKLGDALDSEDSQAAAELGNYLLKRGTQEGQSIQAYSLIKKLSPEGAVLTMLKVNRDSTPKLAQNLIDNADNVVNSLNVFRKEAEDELFNGLENPIQVANPKAPWDFVVNELSKKLASKINKYTTLTIAKNLSPTEEVIKTLFSIAKEELPKRGKKAPDNLFLFVRNALQNKQLYNETYNKAQSLIASKYSNNPEKLQILNDYLTQLKENPYSQDYVNKITSELIKTQNIKLKDLVKANIEAEDFSAQKLKNALIKQLGVDEKTASKFSYETQKRFYKLLKEKRDKALQQYFKDAPPFQKKAIEQRLSELNNMGALDNETYLKEISKKFKIPELKENDIVNVKAITERIQSTTGRDQDIAIGELKKYLASKKAVPIGQKIKTARNVNLLLSSTGRIADALSTGLFQGQEALAELAAGRKLYPKEWIGGFKKGIKYGIEDVSRGINTSRISAHDTYDLPYGRTLQQVPIYNKAEEILDYMIRVPDRAFEEARYASSLAQQMKKANVLEPTEEMIANAIDDAKRSTFKGDSVSSSLATGAQKTLNHIGIGGVGLGDFQIPFAKTLGNIAEESIKYSPFNYLTSAYDYWKGNPRSASTNFGKANVGTGLTALGAGLGAWNAHTGALPDKDTRANYQATGRQPFSVNTPIGNIQYSRIQPLSSSLAFGQGLYEGWQSGNTLPDKMQGALGGGVGAVISNQIDQPYTKGTKKVLDNISQINRTKGLNEKSSKIADTLLSTGTNYFSQMFPFSSTASNINRANIPFISDPYRRQIDYSNPFEVAMSRYPIASQQLPLKKSVTGQNIGYNNTDIPFVSQAEGLFNPFNIENVNPNPMINELIRINEPLSVVKNKIKIDGKMTKLNSKQVSQYQRLVGLANDKFINDFVNSDEYANMNDDQRIEKVQNLQKQVNKAVKSKLFGTKPLLSKKQPTRESIIARKMAPFNRIKNLIQKSNINEFVNSN